MKPSKGYFIFLFVIVVLMILNLLIKTDLQAVFAWALNLICMIGMLVFVIRITFYK